MKSFRKMKTWWVALYLAYKFGGMEWTKKERAGGGKSPTINPFTES